MGHSVFTSQSNCHREILAPPFISRLRCSHVEGSLRTLPRARLGPLEDDRLRFHARLHRFELCPDHRRVQGRRLHCSTNSYSKDDGYGGKQDCPYGQERVTKTVFKEFCEAYTDRVCRTTHEESCTDVPDKNCRAVVTNQQNRKCFDVTELVCKLREDVKYETVQVGFTVQKCHKVQERVCDTVYDTSFTTKENHMCIRVNNPFCKFEERAIVDKTCRTVTKFDCPTEAKDNGMGSSGGYGDSTGYGKGGDDYNSGYGKGGDDYNSGYGKGGDDSGIEQPQCKRSQTTKCYDTPRTVSVPRCSQNSEKVCESMPTRVPTVNERQHCHNEDKKVCELEERTQPKQVKKYVYTKQC